MTLADRFDPAAPEAVPISLRIVVDGASTAGKTTTARALGDRLGRPVHTPAEAGGRTLLFDWLDHLGGRSDGRAIRTQVVAVPGHLPHLRARLLVTADVVLFVADTTAAGMAATEAALAQVRALLRSMPAPPPGLVIQANKRDHPDALPIDEVARRLAIGPDDLVIETVATEGEGVRQSYVYAVRVGLQHIRESTSERIAERQQTAEALLAELDTDPRPVAEVDEPEAEPQLAAAPAAGFEAEPAPAVWPDFAPDAEPVAAVDPEPPASPPPPPSVTPPEPSLGDAVLTVPIPPIPARDAFPPASSPGARRRNLPRPGWRRRLPRR